MTHDDKVRDAFKAWAQVEYRNADEYTLRDFEIGLAAYRFALSTANAGTVADKAQPLEQEPVEYQVRSRPMWREEGKGWSSWEKCLADSYADYAKAPVLHDWQYEVRKLYVAPVPKPVETGAREDVILEQAREALDAMLNLRDYGSGHGSDHQVETHNNKAYKKAGDAIKAIAALSPAAQAKKGQDNV